MYNTNKNMEEKKEGIKMINQGTYGCIFRPGLTCEGMLDDNKKLITKVQKQKKTSANEVAIGKELMEIKNYERYYAPIIDSCDVDIGKIQDGEVRNCDFIEKNKEEGKSLQFEINKIPFVGKKTLGDYYLDLLEKNGEKKFGEKFINGYKVLIEGARKMSERGIIHYDIKENNIMCRTGSGRPIYIDYGLSFNINEVLKNNDLSVFYVYAPDYPAWCLEINVLSYLMNEIGDKIEKKEELDKYPVSIETIKECIESYYKENKGINRVFSEEEIEEQKVKALNYFSGIINKVGFGTTKWRTVKEELLKTYETWDIYGVSMTYLQLYKDLSIDEKEIPHMLKMKEILKDVVSAMPNERPNGKELLLRLKKELGKTSRKNEEKLIDLLKRITDKDRQMRRERYVDSKMKSVKRVYNVDNNVFM